MSGGSPTFKSNPNPGKLNTSFWETAFKKEDKPKERAIPKKVSLYGKSFYDDKATDADSKPQEKPKEVIYDGSNLKTNASTSSSPKEEQAPKEPEPEPEPAQEPDPEPEPEPEPEQEPEPEPEPEPE
eukprot:CAMPEP_0201568296 /NCGR_PEP_ID=MMETSP0190_2-20130828/9297_1 /ASSEMBLY_ACC=CAM_ASM_000263 /TAXON_ID=37353 /ORGANISM="Rosalina sp." /LENGTH=126 /DNA_ID=CAMNT_0047989245 /DNA_START=13 /DNA_END=390 /DNA_ORIENTATION=-